MKTNAFAFLFSHRARFILAGGGLLAVALLFGWLSQGQPHRQPSGAGQDAARKPAPLSASTPVSESLRDSSSSETAVADKTATAGPSADRVAPLAAAIQKIAAAWRRVQEDGSLDAEGKKAASRALLAELRDMLRSAEPDAATAAILQFLDSGADSATGLGFTLEEGGLLADAPSMRTALLDLLGQFDPSAAVDYANRLFNGSQVPDEWALALRNLGWQNHNGEHTSLMRTRFQEMLGRNDWVATPSEGFLHAFDAAVHLGGMAELNGLIGLVLPVDGNDRPLQNGLTHAAYLGLDRMTVQNPLQTLETLTQNPDLLEWAPEHRSSLIARADVTNPQHRTLVETYLATLVSRPQELETFTSLFPNRNGSLGYNLITTAPTSEGPGLRESDADALRVVNEWIRNGQYGPIESNLRRISARLTSFLATE